MESNNSSTQKKRKTNSTAGIAGDSSRMDVSENVAPTYAKILERKKNEGILELNRHLRKRLDAKPDNDKSKKLILEYLDHAQRLESLCGGNPCATVLSFGDNDAGQLVLSEANLRRLLVTGKDLGPTQTPVGNCIRSVAAGGLHSVFVSKEGWAYAAGNPDKGLLGHRGDGLTLQPVNIPKGDRNVYIQKCATGSGHTAFLSPDGEVYQCGMFKDCDSLEVKTSLGEDGCAQHGFDTDPVLVHLPGKVYDIAARESVNAAILENGQLFTWGLGNSGQLARSEGMKTTNESGEYDLSPAGFSYIRDGEEKSYDLPVIAEHFLKPKEVIWETPWVRRRVIAVSVGAMHIVASATGPEGHGQVFTSGENSSGQLGHGDTISRHQMTLVESLKNHHITRVAAGGDFTLVGCFGTNNVWACGLGKDGELGTGLPSENGSSTMFQPVLFPEEISLTQLEAAKKHSFALAHSADYQETGGLDVWSWGYNVSRVIGHSNDVEHVSKLDDYEVFFRPVKLDLSDVSKKPNMVTRVFGLSAGENHTLMMTQSFPKA